ncbi:MAG: SLC13 family permease [Gammaproteobacteria bacterium CG11_big_fil_rev_8_21_14_0_20_46_22]|nr:MAG: SLC13 family permease [Gammaproteobacteria bacterium CG12_big_fil_rev_8_21_14_0_65_46_12]PIR12111.1 MAG: SLC13 family permease [Gammaproteobacteria bacterium CG11_big_fil_rev_8_21_14_0_20_46_22]
MTFAMLVTILTCMGVIAALLSNRFRPEWVILSSVVVLLVCHVITPAQGFAGFSNPGVIIIAALYVVAAGIEETGALRFALEFLLSRPKRLSSAMFRLVSITAGLSAFLNNTPIVAILIGQVQVWAKKLGFPASKLLLPLSYAAILGGMLTLIGTSTNLVVSGLLVSMFHIHLGIFSIFPIGFVVLVLCGTWLVFFGSHLLPSHQVLVDMTENPKEYSVLMRVSLGSPLVGQSLASAHLRELAHGYLAEIERNSVMLDSVSAETLLKVGDRLMFVGGVDCARELKAIEGLETDAHSELDVKHHAREFVEVVLSAQSPLVGHSVKTSGFRRRYQAVVLAVSRDGVRLSQKAGDIVLQAGDTLLLESGANFAKKYRHSREFLLVSVLGDVNPSRKHKAPVALGILLGMVILHVAGLLDMVTASVTAALLMVVLGCLRPDRAKKSIHFDVLLVIAGAMSLGQAVLSSGLASVISHGLLELCGHSLVLSMVLLYCVTVLFSSVITHSATAVLMFPIAASMSHLLGVSVVPFAVTVMFAASASFLTPIGYQTNMMVCGPGGYRFGDYVKAGLPVTFLAGLGALCTIPFVFPF